MLSVESELELLDEESLASFCSSDEIISGLRAGSDMCDAWEQRIPFFGTRVSFALRHSILIRQCLPGMNDHKQATRTQVWVDHGQAM